MHIQLHEKKLKSQPFQNTFEIHCTSTSTHTTTITTFSNMFITHINLEKSSKKAKAHIV